MKKQLLVLLMLGAFVGQVQAAEGNESNTTVEVNLSKNGRGQIDGGTIDLYSVKNGEKKSEKGFPKAILEGQAGIAGRWKGDFPLVEDRLTIIKSWFPGDRELQKVNKLEIVEKQKEEEAQRLARVKTEKEAEALRKQQEKAEKLAAEKAEKERIEKEREEAAAAKREQERLAEEQRVAAELARKRAFEEAEIIRIAEEFQRAEELRLRLQAEAEAKIALEEQLRAEALVKEQARIAAEKAELARIAELERIAELKIAELKIAEQREQARLAEIERVRVEEENKLQQIEDEKRAQEAARTQKIAIEQARLAQVTGREYPGYVATCTNCRGTKLGASHGSHQYCGAFHDDPDGRCALVKEESLNRRLYSSVYIPQELLPLTLLEVRNLIAQAYNLTKVASLPDDEYSPLFEKFYNTARGAYENPFVNGEFFHPVQYKENPWAHNIIALITELRKRIPNAFNAFGGTNSTEINWYFKGENKSRQNNLVDDVYRYGYSGGSKFHDYEKTLIQSSEWIDAVKQVLAQPEASAAAAAENDEDAALDLGGYEPGLEDIEGLDLGGYEPGLDDIAGLEADEGEPGDED